VNVRDGATEVVGDDGATEVVGDDGATEAVTNDGATEAVTNDGVTELDNGAGYTLRIGATSIAELTVSVNGLCRRIEDRSDPVITVLRLGGVCADQGWPGEVGVQDVNRWEKAVRRLERLAGASVAVAEHDCGGPALDLLLAADYRIATADLRLLFPINDGHFWPGMSVYRLAHQVGLARARQLVLWGHEMSAPQATSLGLVDEIAADVDEAVRAAVVFLGRIADAELAIRRRLLLEAPATSFEEALGAHLAACDRELRRIYPRDQATAQPTAR
jgi:isomerase DpgB